MKNIKIDHKILAKHFNKTPEAMRQLKRKHEYTKDGLWIVYVKAYNHDISLEKEKKVCNWKKDDWNDDNVYNTECGNAFYLSTDDTPEEHQFKYCPYCGGELKYAILLPDEIEKLMEE